MTESYRIPRSWLEANQQERNKIANGCGAGGWKFDLVPDTIWGLCITEICNWHDFDYTFLPKTRANKKLADDNFYHNLKVLITNKSNIIMRYPRLLRAWTYYNSVSKFGEAAFLNGGKFLE